MQPNTVIPLWDQIPELTWSERVAYVAHQIGQIPEQTELPLNHLFEPGMYIREIAIPAGTVLVGRPHVFGHECELVSGQGVHVDVSGRNVIEAPYKFHSTPGYQIVFYAMTDVIGRTYHPNEAESRDTQALEDMYFAPAEPVRELGAALHQRLLTSQVAA